MCKTFTYPLLQAVKIEFFNICSVWTGLIFLVFREGHGQRLRSRSMLQYRYLWLICQKRAFAIMNCPSCGVLCHWRHLWTVHLENCARIIWESPRICENHSGIGKNHENHLRSSRIIENCLRIMRIVENRQETFKNFSRITENSFKITQELLKICANHRTCIGAGA